MDIGTLSLVAVLLLAVQVLALAALWDRQKAYPGHGWCILGRAANLLAFLFAYLRVVPEWTSWASLFGMLLFLLGDAGVWIGTARFFGRKVPWLPTIALIAASAVAFLYWTFADDGVAQRRVVLYVVAASFSGAVVWTTLRWSAAAERRPALLLAWVEGVQATALLAASLLVFGTAQNSLELAPSLSSVLAQLTTLVLSTLASFALVLLINRRLIGEASAASRSLAVTTARFERAIRGTSDGIWDWNVVTGSDYHSPRYHQLLGFEEGEVPPTSDGFEALVHPDDLPRVNAAQRDHLVDHQPYAIEFRMRHRSGDWRWFLSRGQAEWSPDGEPLRMSGSLTDVTERRRLDSEIDKLLAEKELLLQEVHHRIKNNMLTMSSLLTLQSQAASEPATSHALGEAAQRLRSMLILYEKLFFAHDYESVSMAEYLHDLVEQSRRVSGRGAEFDVDYQLGDLVLDASRALSVGILVNELVDNAFKYARTAAGRPRLTLEIHSLADRAFVVVADNGAGFSEANPSSTGFGLTLTRQIADNLGGELRLDASGGVRWTLEFGASPIVVPT
ncbi:MAG: PAS domain-containing protein [Spirochaetales bacterium]